MLNPLIFSFIILNLVKKGVLDFHVTTATDICMKEVIDSCLRRALWRKIMETLKAFIVTIIVLNFVSKGLSFYYTIIFTGPSISYRALGYKQFVVTFTDSSSRLEVSLYIRINRKTPVSEYLFHKVAGLWPYAVLKIKHSDTGVYP